LAQSTSRSREFGVRIAFVLGSILAGLLMLEIAVRFIEPRETMRYFFVQPDSILHHKFIPNAKGHYKTPEFNTEYTINSLGLRDYEFPAEKPAGTFRILMVGDSFTEGDGVEANETFSKVLERHLGPKLSSEKFQVINAGCGGYSPILEYLYLKTSGITAHPDLVILFYDLSDVFDDIDFTRIARLDADGVPMGVSPGPTVKPEGAAKGVFVGIKDFFKEHTRLYNFIRLRIDRYLEGAKHEGKALGDIRKDKYAMLRENYPVADDSELALSYKYILLIRDMLRERGIDFWVCVYPYGMQASPREYVEGRKFWGFKPDTVYSTRPQSFMEGFCGRNGIRSINMCDEFRARAKVVHPLYLNFNGHWTSQGHVVAADVLERELLPYLKERSFGEVRTKP
jgi:hypothetical protein